MNIIFQLIFLAGVIFQFCLMLKYFPKKKDLKKTTLIAIGIIFIITLMASIETGFETFFFNLAIITSVLLTLFFRKELTSYLDEKIFIFFNILLIYFLMLNGTFILYFSLIFVGIIIGLLYFSIKKMHSNNFLSKILFVSGAFLIFITIIFGTIVFAFFDKLNIQNEILFAITILIPIFFIISTIPNKVHATVFQGTSYLWHLFIIVIIEVFVFREIYIRFIIGEELPFQIYFFLGASFVYLTTLIINIIMSLPLTSKKKPIDQSMEDVFRSMILFSEKYDNYQINKIETITIILFSIILFTIHYFTKFITFEYLVIILIPVILFVFRIKNNAWNKRIGFWRNKNIIILQK
jgi:hypothetical protein